MLTNLWFDLKYACRLWTKAPGYFLVCVTVVALSVGLALWASVLAYTLTMKPLPFAGSERWMNIQVAKNATAGSVPDIDRYTYQEIAKRSAAADHLGSYTVGALMLSNGNAATRLRAAAMSPRLLRTTGVLPLAGRLFDEADSAADAAPTAILSYLTWKTYFAGDPAIVGKPARIDGRSVQVVGVMPESFFAFDDFEIWTPLRLAPLTAPDSADGNIVSFILL